MADDLYERQTWTNGQAGGTPLNATRLNHVEIGIDDIDNMLQDHHDRLEALEAGGGVVGKYVGSTADRALIAPGAGVEFYDTTLGKPLWGTGSAWVYADGTSVSGAGASNAPTNLLAEAQPDNSITLTWTAPAAIDGDDTYKVYETGSPSGVPGFTAVTATTCNITPGNNRTFQFWVTANVDGTESAISNVAVVTLPYGGGSGTGGGDTPAEILNINGEGTGVGGWWNIGIGFRSADPEGAVHKDITPAQLADGYTRIPYVCPNATNTGVKFRVYCDGARTSTRTKYPRSELRGYNSNGTTQQSFSMSSNTTLTQATTKVLHQTSVKPEICLVQLHDGADDRFQFRWENGDLVCTVNGGSGDGGTDHDLGVHTSLNTAINWKMTTGSGRVKLYLDNVLKLDQALTGSGMYVKTGCYAQSNNRDQANSASDYHEIEMSGLIFTLT